MGSKHAGRPHAAHHARPTSPRHARRHRRGGGVAALSALGLVLFGGTGVALAYDDIQGNIQREDISELLGREPEAKAYLDLYDRHLARVTERVAGLSDKQRPKVFLELLAGVWQAPGHTTGKSGLGSLVAAVGGHNIGADVVPGAVGDVSVEYVLQADPDVYIATGNRAPGVLLGAGVATDTARQSLAHITARPEFAQLRPIQAGQAHGLWHDFYNSPFNILAIEAMARWIHPERFKDLDPQATLAEINRLLNIGLDGQYWVDAR